MVSETVNLGHIILSFDDLTNKQKEEIKGIGLEFKVDGNNFLVKREDEDNYSIINLNGLDFNWKETLLGVKNSLEKDYDYVDLKGSDGWLPTFRLDEDGNLFVNDGNKLTTDMIYTKNETEEILKTKADKIDVDDLKQRIMNLEELENIIG